MELNRANLLKIIEASGRTRKWVAEQACVETDTINQYLCGTRNPSKAVVRLLSIALEVPESELTIATQETPKAS